MMIPGESPALYDDILAAHDRLRPYIRETPCDKSIALGWSDLDPGARTEVFLKLENLQHTGSFKARGALNRILCLTPAERARGVVTASSGNHGAGVAWASAQLGVAATVFVPQQAAATKVAMIERHGATVHRVGTDGLDTEQHARRIAEQQGRIYVSPYNDAAVMAGQGTVGVELASQLENVGAVYVAVGGGGLIGGIAAYLSRAIPSARIIGAQPENSAVMAHSIGAGRVVEMPSLPTLSDGTAGGIESDTVTFPVCQSLVDDWVLVSEGEIADAMRRFIDAHHLLIEGSAGVAVAAFEKNRARHVGERVAIVVCGGNISLDRLRDVIDTR
jgi:threonine dehydratase